MQLLKDFLVTMKTHFPLNMKYECFLRMAGMHEIMHRPRIDLETYIKRNSMRLRLWESPKVFHLFVHFCLEVKNSKKSNSDYFMPNHDDNHSYLIPSSTACLVAETCWGAFGMPNMKIKDLIAEIPDKAEKDMFRRMMMQLTVHEKEGPKHKYIAWDALAIYVLENYIQFRLVHLEDFATDLRLVCKDKYESRSTFSNFCFALKNSDEYSAFARDQEWLKSAYSQFI